jgi:hypothetical protein
MLLNSDVNHRVVFLSPQLQALLKSITFITWHSNLTTADFAEDYNRLIASFLVLQQFITKQTETDGLTRRSPASIEGLCRTSILVVSCAEMDVVGL